MTVKNEITKIKTELGSLEEATQIQDTSPEETAEWIEAFCDVIENASPERATFLIQKLQETARRHGISIKNIAQTAYINTIPVYLQAAYPGNLAFDKRLTDFVRWNAMAMVVRAGKKKPELGGHIASYASAAVLYQVGLLYFFRVDNAAQLGDLVFIQGHSSPGLYAQAYLSDHLSEERMDNFRQEVASEGLASYPHPWLMPNFWQFATVSMGLGPIQAIYQARFLKYLSHRHLLETEKRHVWAFCGDGEMDEPESLGAIQIAVKEKLDNLIFVINCNLQRLDGPVRGNGKIVQDLEGIFAGAGWHVIKVIWDSHWDALLERDVDGKLQRLMAATLDGEYQTLKAKSGDYLRTHFFGKDPDLLSMVVDYSDADLEEFLFGGHDYEKVFAAYQRATATTDGKPTVILAKTTKGYGMGAIGQGQNTTHQQKKLPPDALLAFRDKFNIPLDNEAAQKATFIKPAPEILNYFKEKRANLGGAFPQRRMQAETALPMPALDSFTSFFESSGDREFSTTMGFVRVLNHLLKDKAIGSRIVPIVPDECRTFGMEGMFRQYGIYSAVGQLYEPVDAGQLMYYKESQTGQLFEEGLTEAGAFASWLAAATSYSVNNFPMIPFYIYYSMFGHQRVGDFVWAAADMRARGFLLGSTAGRTSLPGEGLQHQDGHSHVFANVVPNAKSYDPTFVYELAVIIQQGLHEMYVEQKDCHYYLTLTTENYIHPAPPAPIEEIREGIIKGMYLYQKAEKTKKNKHVQLLGSGTILREAIAAADLLADFDVSADIWSVPSFNELAREAMYLAREAQRCPDKAQKPSYLATCLADTMGPCIAATDYIRAYAEQIRAFIPEKHYVTLGTDGFGRSDTRLALRDFFEVDAKHIAYTALYALYVENNFSLELLLKARKTLQIDANKPTPWTV